MADHSDDAFHIPVIKTGIPGLDAVLGGGLPEGSFNLLAGAPGSGKTTLVMQLLFSNASKRRPAVYFTGLGEPTIKLLRHQQQFPFFDAKAVGRNIHFIHLGNELETGNLESLLQRIIDEVARLKPSFVVVDSFRAMARVVEVNFGEAQIERFVQRLATHLTTWEVTSFLVGEHGTADGNSPVFTVADGVIWLTQALDRNSVVRKLQVVKVRGQASMPGLHTFRIGPEGVQVFPRMRHEPSAVVAPRPARKRLSTGIAGLDEMMGGGIPGGDVVAVAGPSGSGKTTFAMQFALDGLTRGESVVVAGFEEYPREYFAKASALGGKVFDQAVQEGRFEVVYLRPLDLSVDETMQELRDTVKRLGVTRVVIDSLAGFEIALAPTFRQDFRESLHRLLGVMKAIGVTVMVTNEIADGYLEQVGRMDGVSFLSDDIILNRYVEIDGAIRRVVSITKMRGGRHSAELREYQTTSTGIVLGEVLTAYSSGVPTWQAHRHPEFPGLVPNEMLVATRLGRLGPSAIKALAADTGLEAADVKAALGRLVEIGYARATSRAGVDVWEALSRKTP